MKGAILKIITYTIIIGVLGLSFNIVFGNQTITFIQKQNITTLQTNFYIWKFDFWHYIENIQLSATDVSVLQFNMPTKTWQNPTDLVSFFPAFGNDMLVILDYIIMVINILLYPIKIGAYLLQNLLAIMGVNHDTTDAYNGLKWLVIFVKEILGNFSIPYL